MESLEEEESYGEFEFVEHYLQNNPLFYPVNVILSDSLKIVIITESKT